MSKRSWNGGKVSDLLSPFYLFEENIGRSINCPLSRQLYGQGASLDEFFLPTVSAWDWEDRLDGIGTTEKKVRVCCKSYSDVQSVAHLITRRSGKGLSVLVFLDSGQSCT